MVVRSKCGAIRPGQHKVKQFLHRRVVHIPTIRIPVLEFWGKRIARPKCWNSTTATAVPLLLFVHILNSDKILRIHHYVFESKLCDRHILFCLMAMSRQTFGNAVIVHYRFCIWWMIPSFSFFRCSPRDSTGGLGVKMVEYVLGGSPTNKESPLSGLEPRLRALKFDDNDKVCNLCFMRYKWMDFKFHWTNASFSIADERRQGQRQLTIRHEWTEKRRSSRRQHKRYCRQWHRRR